MVDLASVAPLGLIAYQAENLFSGTGLADAAGRCSRFSSQTGADGR